MSDPRPACLVTATASDYRIEPFRILRERESVDVLAFGARTEHPDLPVEHVSQLGAARAIASGAYRAAIVSLAGRAALPAAYVAARRANVPFILWASVWAHPRTPAHVLSWPLARHIYRHADAVVTYGPHVTRYVRGHGRTGPVIEAPQAVDPAVFGRDVPAAERAEWRARAGVDEDGFLALFVGRLEREKGLPDLLAAWERAALDDAALAVAGSGPLESEVVAAGADVRALGTVGRERLAGLYAASDVLVLPSVATATFREPWGLVTGEAMLQGKPTIASDAVGAVAGGLVEDGRNGLVFPAGDRDALAGALQRLAGDPRLRASLGQAGRADVARYSPAAWAEAMSAALVATGTSRAGAPC